MATTNDFRVGTAVIIKDESWEGGDMLIRGKIVGKEKVLTEGNKGKVLHYNVKPLLADVKSLYDIDYQQYIEAYRKPKEGWFPKGMLTKLSKSKKYPADYWGYQ